MSLGFKLFWVITVCELLLWVIPSLKWRRSLAPFVIAVLIADSLVIIFKQPNIATTVLLIVSLYRAVNLARLIKDQIPKQYLRHATALTSVWLISLQIALLLLWLVTVRLNISSYKLWLGFLCLDFILMLVLTLTTLRQLRKTQAPSDLGAPLADRDLPTLTVAIPARNETDELETCLKSLVASNYPKLEVVVLDDCSQNKRTPDIIRDFAQDGIKFIQGNPPEDSWLAKNLAYQRLAEESNGELILFCGVDVRFQPNSLRQLVLAMLHKQKSMISIIPKNIIAKGKTNNRSILLQPIRYAWEMALPRRQFNRLPVLSTCWIIGREVLDSAGSFGAVSRSIIPESYFAYISAARNGYSFMQSSEAIGITSYKSFTEQQATAIRTRYPQLHRRMELVAMLSLVQIFAAISPYALILLAIFGHLSILPTIISLALIVALTLIYIEVVYLTYRKWIIRAIFLPPVFILLDIGLLNYSMFKYEFSSVFWKGRNICIPIMHTTT